MRVQERANPRNLITERQDARDCHARSIQRCWPGFRRDRLRLSAAVSDFRDSFDVIRPSDRGDQFIWHILFTRGFCSLAKSMLITRVE